MKLDFRLHLSDDYAQNAATKSEHMKKLIHWIYENNLFIKDCIIYDTTYV